MKAEGAQGFLESYFKLQEKNTTIRTEVVAGFTTFISLAYIMFVNPNILERLLFKKYGDELMRFFVIP